MKRSFSRVHSGPVLWLMVSASVMVALVILLPLIQMVTGPTLAHLAEAIKDPDVRGAIGLSLGTSFGAATLCLVFGTPFAYLLARKNFRGKHLVESIVDLPIMIPHPVIGIAFLGIAGKGHFIGDLMHALGIRIMGTTTGIVAVLTFVGLPFFIGNAVSGFKKVPERLENVARSLGASFPQTFLRVTLPLCWRSILVGFIMSAARALSEFGAVIIVAYHPMTAPVMVYERFTAYGLSYSQPVAFWLIAASLLLFVALRFLTLRGETAE
ncbi:ABC transporter permease [Desulfoluna spongiiphila]|uniref:ABC transporter permease n=1 Tax=Desulfoluna spongiiphila TaxID=419481 RepID=UPI0020C89AA5|nr:ABC transporter permease [Desulfoluna spongiiphila]